MNKLGNIKHGGHGTLTYARWVWWLFLAANALMVLLALRLRLDGLLIQQLGFFITSIIGLRNTGFLKASAK
jgi:hypothetical protein